MSLNTNLEAYYKFNNNGIDSSGNGRNLTYTGTEAYAAGILENGYDLPGNEANFADRSMEDVPLRLVGTNYSISCWVNPTTLSGATVIVEKWDSGSPSGWSLLVPNAGSVQFTHGSGVFLATATGLITTGSFHHIAVITNGTTIKIYINGVERASKAFVAVTSSTAVLRVGDRHGALDSPWDGVIDETAIWSRDLSLTELAQLYNNGNGYDLLQRGSSTLHTLRGATLEPHSSSTLHTLRGGELSPHGSSVFQSTRGILVPEGVNLIRGPQFRFNTIGDDRFVNRLSSVLSKIVVNLSSTGQTTLYTVPSGNIALIQGVILRSGGTATSDPTVSVGINPSTDNIFGVQQLVNFQAANDIFSLWSDKSTTLSANGSDQIDLDVIVSSPVFAEIYVIGILL
jgi:hypothetical protein